MPAFTTRRPRPVTGAGATARRGAATRRWRRCRARRARRPPHRARRRRTFGEPGTMVRSSAAICSARAAASRWCTAMSTTWPPFATCSRTIASMRATGTRRRAHLLDRHDASAPDGEDRLDREGRPEQRRGGADAAAAPQVLEGVDVEEDAGGRRAARARRPSTAGTSAPPAAASAAATTANPMAMPMVLAVDDLDRHRRLCRREPGRLDGARHLRRQVDRDDGRRALVGEALVRLGEDLRCRAATS